MSVGAKIKELRKQAGLSQQEVADKLGMARATYAGLEVDRREPDLGELRALADFYEITLMELVAEEGDDWPGVIFEPTVEYRSRPGRDSARTDAHLQVDPTRLREVLLYVLDKVGAKPHFGESVLYKLLYNIDFDYNQKYGHSITGLTYVQNKYGPNPTVAFDEVVKQMEDDGELEIVSTKHFNNTQRKYLPVVSADFQELNASELDHINQVLARLSDKQSLEL